jgi:hypothetical protein
MSDEKVKAQERGNRVDVSSSLSIDSPMVIWHTDLEALGLGGGGSSRGGGSEGASSLGATEQASTYIATCDAVAHPLDEPGTTDDGRWFGELADEYTTALAVAQAHQDGSAYVAIYLNGVLIGPVVQG